MNTQRYVVDVRLLALGMVSASNDSGRAILCAIHLGGRSDDPIPTEEGPAIRLDFAVSTDSYRLGLHAVKNGEPIGDLFEQINPKIQVALHAKLCKEIVTTAKKPAYKKCTEVIFECGTQGISWSLHSKPDVPHAYKALTGDRAVEGEFPNVAGLLTNLRNTFFAEDASYSFNPLYLGGLAEFDKVVKPWRTTRKDKGLGSHPTEVTMLGHRNADNPNLVPHHFYIDHRASETSDIHGVYLLMPLRSDVARENLVSARSVEGAA